MNTMPPDEPEHDAMLRAALRHAPDREARPPEAVSAHILHRAQQATSVTASPPPGGARQALRRWLDALARPAPAAAFASLMLATVIGVMWQEGPPPERRDDGHPPAAQARQEAPKAATEARKDGPGAAPVLAADGARAMRSAEFETATGLPNRRAVPPPAAPAAPTVPSPAARGATPADTAATEKAATAPPAGAAAAPPAAPQEAAAPPGLRRERAATSEGPSVPAAAAPADTPAAPARNMLAAAADPLAPLAEDWTATEAQRAALDELRRLSAGRWVRVPAADLQPSAELRRADGRPLGRLVVIDDAVLWLPAHADALAWRAPLEPAAAADLRRRLALPPGR